MTTETYPQPLHVLIAGGGVAALEAMMALRALAGARVRITVLAPERDFHYRPMAVAEPFTIAHAWQAPLAAITADFDTRLITGTLDGVEPAEHYVTTREGERIAYDALVIACGTRVRPAFEGALTIDDRNLGGTLRGLVQDVEEGYTREIAFVAPAGAFWPLPLYELALLTAHRAYDMNVAVDISIVSPEAAPLTLFGSGISRELTRLLHDAGITFHGSSYAHLADGELTLQPSGNRLRPGRVVALPLLDGPQITGVPTDPHGFVPVLEYGEVRGLDDVYAAGDATSYPIKHGGIAAQQADVVATAIAARAGVAIEPQPLRPVIRGVLLTGEQTRYLEAELVGDAGFSSTVSDICPWDPPTKIVARHLGPYLAHADRHIVHD
ncbi:MAG: sulfide:quinone oxidoreductase [Solirubrobacteraceae bacterium]|jgi:sulfide:quinone oxidoreductase|nr:sulfide:quinone oxidoreductase [Solirubrobacteraceae bacterium]